MVWFGILEEFVVFCWVDGEELPAPSCKGMAQLLCHLLFIYHQDLSYTLRDGREGCPNCMDSALSSGAFTWEEQASFPSALGQKYLRASSYPRRIPQCSPSCPCSLLAGKQPIPSDTKAQEHSVPAPFYFSRQGPPGCPCCFLPFLPYISLLVGLCEAQSLHLLQKHLKPTHVPRAKPGA